MKNNETEYSVVYHKNGERKTCYIIAKYDITCEEIEQMQLTDDDISVECIRDIHEY